MKQETIQNPKFFEKKKLNDLFDYVDFKFQAINFFADTENFFKSLDLIKNKKINQEEKLILAKAFIECVYFQEEYIDINNFIQWACKLKEKLGITPFVQLFEASVTPENANTNYYTAICQLLIELSDDIDTDELLKVYLTDLKKLIQILYEKQIEIFNKKFFEKSLSEAIGSFRKEKFPLTELELKKLQEDYLEVQKYGSELKKFPLEVLCKQAKMTGRDIKSYKTVDANSLKLIALLREVFLFAFKIYPHTTQILALLAQIRFSQDQKGRILQVGTGQGKSLLNTLLAAYFGCQNICVDIVTSNRYLAIRDQVKFKEFFHLLGITSSHICFNHPQKQHFNGQVLYGINSDFEFAVLGDEFLPEKKRYTEVDGNMQERPFTIVLPDEVDSLLLNDALNSARFAIPIAVFESKSWIYEPILEFIKSKERNFFPSPAHLLELRNFLNDYCGGQFSHQVKLLDNEQLCGWIKNAQAALFDYHAEREYVVIPQEVMTLAGLKFFPQVVIVDKLTGEYRIGSRWQGGLHEFVEVKEGLKPEDESLTFASISHTDYFRRYECIFGLTGTGGEAEERKEIKSIYHVDLVDIPSHLPNQRIQQPAQYFLNEDAYYQAILLDVQSVIKDNRAVLVLCATIADSKKISQFLHQKSLRHQMINEMQREDESYLVHQAGLPGMITIATNKAGRGTDIRPTRECEKAGGLHVILIFFTEFLRDEEQGFGRAARQGANGSCRSILFSEDPSIKKLIPNQAHREKLATEANFIEILSKLRTLHTMVISQRRMKLVQIESIRYGILNQLSQLLQFFYIELNKINIGDIAKTCAEIKNDTNNNLDDKKLFPVFLPLKKRAQHFLALQMIGTEVDWHSLLMAFIETYIVHVQQVWGRFFTDHLSCKNAGQKEFFDFIEANMRHYFENSQNFFIETFSCLLQQSIKLKFADHPQNDYLQWRHQFTLFQTAEQANAVSVSAYAAKPVSSEMSVRFNP